MLVIIGTDSISMKQFTSCLIEEYQVINKICDLKNVKSNITLLIPFEKCLDNGIVENTEVSLDEFFIMYLVDELIYGCIESKNILTEICNYYKVDLRHIQID